MTMKFHVVFPAAGTGSRFGLDIPKQYCEINGKAVMEWTLTAFQNVADLGQQIIVLSENDPYAKAILTKFPNLSAVNGGADRASSVLNGLRFLLNTASEDDWVLVHDIARPCIPPKDIKNLIRHIETQNRSAVLGRPVTDTIKQKGSDGLLNTVDRSTLWAMQTPQCFPLGMLKNAIEFCLAHEKDITDEASAIEAIGQSYDVVVGPPENMKLTHPDDDFLIAHFLERQENKK